MNWKRAIGFGILIWVLMFAIISAFVAFKLNTSAIWMGIIFAVIGFIISLILAGYVKPATVGLALSYGLVWVLVALILDYFISTRFAADIFKSWTLWLGYFLVLMAPVLRVKKSS